MMKRNANQSAKISLIFSMDQIILCLLSMFDDRKVAYYLFGFTLRLMMQFKLFKFFFKL